MEFRNMKRDIIVFASKYVGIEIVRYLLESGYPVTHIVCGNRNDRKILSLASKRGIYSEVYSPSTQAELIEKGYRYSWLINAWSPHILKEDLLSLVDHRINIHPGIVPMCRGNDNATWTLRMELPPGVSLIEMRKGIDEGEIYGQKYIKVDFPITGRALHEKLQKTAIEFFKELWPHIYEGKIRPYRQEGDSHTFTRSMTNRDRVIDGESLWKAKEFVQWALAHDFYPDTTGEIYINGIRYRIRIFLEQKG